MGKKLNLLNCRFGRLKVLTENHYRTNGGGVRWDCICDCGNLITVPAMHLKSGHTQSCGCYRIDQVVKSITKHGKAGSKVYNAWCSIKERCCNPNNKAYENYGGAGITVHESFINDFQAFYAEIGEPPDETPDWSVDRVDHTKGYEPGNLRWATPPQQAQNRGMQSNNSSGYTGVSFMSIGKNEYWVAHWNNLNGRHMSRVFNIKEFGYERAKELAIEARKDAIKQLNAQGAGYTENHGL